MKDQPPPLHEQVRTLEADLVMCREQLAQETERAESYRLDVAAIRDALDAPEDADINQLIDVVHALTEQVEKAQQLPEPDHTNPAHLLPSSLCGDLGPDSLVKCTRPHGHDGDHWHTGLDGKGQAWAYACADIEPDSRVRCQRPKGHPGDHRYQDDYGNGIGWGQADADEELIEKAAQAIFSSGGISNGRLLAMDSDRRAEVIASLSPEVRRQLANIASLGASRLISQVIADKYDWRTANRMLSARDFTDLAANLLRDGDDDGLTRHYIDEARKTVDDALGLQRNMNRCALTPYGYNACPEDEACDFTCNGAKLSEEKS